MILQSREVISMLFSRSWEMERANLHLIKVMLNLSKKSKRMYISLTNQSIVRPLAEMYSAVSLPPNLGRKDSVPLLHSDLKGHVLFKRPVWKPKRFTLDAYLDEAEFEAATREEYRNFWRWLRDNRGELARSRALRRIANLPVWPSVDNVLVTLAELCEPPNSACRVGIGERYSTTVS